VLAVLLVATAALLAPPPVWGADGSWLYDPLQVTEIDLGATDAALAQLRAAPDQYVDASITLRNGGTTYGPYAVGLKLKGHTSFRTLDHKAAFKVKFAHSVSGQKFQGLKSLTLNNMVQDPSMLAEAASSLLMQAVGAPTARVGYAFVRLNGAVYGLYSDVETLDNVWAKRWFASLQHLYEGNNMNDVGPGRSGEFEVQEGSETDRADLEALGTADAAGSEGWWERMQPAADLAEMTTAWAAEHYIGQWDGYSVESTPFLPNNYYLESDANGRFSMIVTGTDQTWICGEPLGLVGKGVLMRHAMADPAARRLYVDAMRRIAASPAAAALADRAREIRDVIEPWRALDPQSEYTLAEHRAAVDVVVAAMAARPAELAAWLESPSFPDAEAPSPPPSSGSSGDTGGTAESGITEAGSTGGGAATPAAPGAPATVASPANRVTSAPLVRAVLGKPLGIPASPVAGRRFTFTILVTQSGTKKPLLGGRMDCSPTVAGRQIAHTDSFRHGKARLSFVVPLTAKGKVLRVRIEITSSGRTVGHTYAYGIR
jgi:hypothetical protein